MKFRKCLDECELFDLGFKGRPFTWQWNKVQERLDCAVANVEWRMKFPEASVRHLPKLKFDHDPILISTMNNITSNVRDKPFRFLGDWLLHKGFVNMVKEA